MKRTTLTLAALLALGGLFLAESTAVRAAARAGLALCAAGVIPALFPFLVVSSLLLRCGFGDALGHGLGRWMGLFHLPGAAAAPVALGLIGGYPVGVRATAELYRTGGLSREEANHLLTFCNNASPAYFLSVVGTPVFGSVRAGLALWAIHLAAGAATGLLFRRPRCSPAVPSRPGEPPSLSAAFVAAVGESAVAMVPICAFVTFFFVLSRPLAALGGAVGAALTGMVELFSLTPQLRADGVSFVLAAACGGFGGLSVLSQSAAALADTDLSPRWCFVGKAVQGLLSALLAALLWPRL